MMRTATTNATTPQMTWVTVTDSQGRQRLEARWSVPAAAQAPTTAHAA